VSVKLVAEMGIPSPATAKVRKLEMAPTFSTVKDVSTSAKIVAYMTN
jgi:hypothetical protein